MMIDDISMAVISLIRVGAAFRFVYCMVRLQGAEEEQALNIAMGRQTK